MEHAPSRYYVPHGTRWPIFGSIGLFTMMVGTALWLNAYAIGPWVVTGGFGVLLVMLFGWFGTVIGESESGRYNLKVDASFRWAMSWFIFSEVMFFGVFFGTLFYSRILVVPWLAGEGDNFFTNFILWPAGPPAEGERQTAIAFWQGVPRPARYTSLIDRYLKFPRLRRDAFRCRQAYARVRARLEGNREPFSFRRDVWFCDELPFGVAQFEDQVIDGTNTIATRQRWQVVATGRLNEHSPLAQPEP